jgi:hypothetical protein
MTVAKMLFTVTWPAGKPTLKKIMKRYGLHADEIDDEFGVIEIAPQTHQYSIMVEEEAVKRYLDDSAKNADDEDIRGPFSNPRIEPFGPPQ